MKKILSLVLALTMVLCMGTAFATEAEEATTSKVEVVDFMNKIWEGEEYHPSEALSFEVLTAVAGEGAESTVTVNSVALEMAEGGETFTLTHDVLQPGSYIFTLKEVDNGSAGVTYCDGEYTLEILATYVLGENDVPTEEIEYKYAVELNEKKDNDVFNYYYDGEVTVKKVVTGNLANKNDTFSVTVTFTSAKPVNMPITVNGTELAASAWTEGDTGYTATAPLTVKAADTEGYKITGIPAGVVVTVEEANPAPYTLVKYMVNDKEGDSVTVVDDDNSIITIYNEYTTEIQTGVDMDSMPYIVLMGLVVLAGVALILKKRAVRD